MVLLHHAPGWDEWYREATRKFAHHGYATISHNLYHRAGEGKADDVAAKVRAEGGVPDAQVIGDTEGAVQWLRAQPWLNGKVGVFGTCSGGRQTFLYACQTNSIDAACELWGGRVVMSKEELNPKQPVAPIEYTQEPVLPAARSVRQRGPRADPGAGRPARGRAEEVRQELRVPPLRRRRARLLLLRPAGLPHRAGARRLAEGVGVPAKST